MAKLAQPPSTGPMVERVVRSNLPKSVHENKWTQPLHKMENLVELYSMIYINEYISGMLDNVRDQQAQLYDLTSISITHTT